MPISDPVQRAEQARTAVDVPDKQQQDIYKDWREMPVHIFLGECYSGTGGFSGKTDQTYSGEQIRSYIIPNASENFYRTRIRMSAYNNYFAKYINAKFSPIFSKDLSDHVTLESTGDLVENHPYYDFLSNVTGGGVTKQEFAKHAIREAYIHDVVFVIMDKRKKEKTPFIYGRSAADLIDHTVDVMGGLSAVWFDAGYDDIDGRRVYYRQYIGVDEWRTEISENRKDWKAIPDTQVKNRLGFLPVYPMFTQRPEDLKDYAVVNPTNRDIAGMNVWVYDKGSKLDYLIDKQAHSILKIQGAIDSLPNGRDNALVIAESERSIFEPGYISPDAALPEVHSKRIEQMMRFMFDLMADSGVEAVEAVGQAESGVSKSYDFLATNNTLKKTTALLSEFDRWLFTTYKAFTGDNGAWRSYCEYPTEFMPRASMTAQQYMDLYDFYIVNNLYESAQDTLVRLRMLIDPMADRKEMQTILDEIESVRRAD